MVSSLSIFFMGVSVFCALVLPIILMIYLWAKTRYDLLIIAFGGIGFYFAQSMVKMGVLTGLAGSGWFNTIAKYPILIGLFLALFAGLLAEVTRILIFMFLVKKEDRNWKNSIAYGLGYGGIESIMMVGLAFISFIGYSIAINNGFFDTQIGIRFTQIEALQIKADLLRPSYIFLLGGLERVVLLVFQMALSLVVMRGVAEGEPVYFGYALLAHVALNVPLIILGQLHRLVGFAWLIVVGVVAFKFILKAKKDFFQEPDGPLPL